MDRGDRGFSGCREAKVKQRPLSKNRPDCDGKVSDLVVVDVSSVLH